jgi:hypothetical protein
MSKDLELKLRTVIDTRGRKYDASVVRPDYQLGISQKGADSKTYHVTYRVVSLEGKNYWEFFSAKPKIL